MTRDDLERVTGVRWLTFRAEAKTGCGVYLLVRDGTVVYVGHSVDIPGRIAVLRNRVTFDLAIWCREVDKDRRVEIMNRIIRLSGAPQDNDQGNNRRRNRVEARIAKENGQAPREKVDPLEEWHRMYNTPGQRAKALRMLRL